MRVFTRRLLVFALLAAAGSCADTPVGVTPERATRTVAAPISAAALNTTPLPALTYTVENLAPTLEVGPFGGGLLVGDGGEAVIIDGSGMFHFWDGASTPLGGDGVLARPFEIGADGRVVGWAIAGGAFEPTVWDAGVPSSLPGGPGSAFDVNGSGTIIGATGSTLGDLLIWTPGIGVARYAVPDFDLVRPRFINSTGDVLMAGFDTDPSTGALRRTALIWTDGVATAIPSVCANMDVAASRGTEYLNGAGQAIGQCSSGSGAWYFDGTAARAVPTLGGTRTTLQSINATGLAAGYSQDGTGAYHAVVYDGSALLDFGLLGGEETLSRGINDAGIVIGVVAGAGIQRAWVTEAGAPRLLPGLGGGTESYARDINASGVIVGSAQDVTGVHRAVAWRPASRTEIVANIQARLDDLVSSGSVAPGPARAMRATLDANALRAFMEQVEGLVRTGKVDPEVAQSFIDAARTARSR